MLYIYERQEEAERANVEGQLISAGLLTLHLRSKHRGAEKKAS
jgi:hypothetical protein